ncbi:penicillin-binding protein 2 [Patescibacteria group bacterium AH-259-L07]|nr:penicillin-binding protein 2 [Patescibacteria group bacterium AH-259-L07]
MHTNRLKIIMVGVFMLGAIIVWRLFELQVLKKGFNDDALYSRGPHPEIINPDRGKIYIFEDDGYQLLAVNISKYNVIASPAIIENVDEWVGAIAPYLGIDGLDVDNDGLVLIEEKEKSDELKVLFEKLSQKNDFYEVIKKDIDVDEVEDIKKLGLEGIHFEKVPKRYYPEKSLFSHVVGFVSEDSECSNQTCISKGGQYGLEEFFDEELRGIEGEMKVERAPGGYIITSSDTVIEEAQPGIDLVLTLDRSIQFFVCSALRDALGLYRAESGSIIVLDPNSGKVLALCNQPDFNPNMYSQENNFAVFKNTAASSVFEPGSVFKVITMAAALDSGSISPETTYIDTGSVTIEDYTITNVDNRTNGRVTMTNVLEKSINTGAVYAVQKVGRKAFRNYLKKFGFGSLTGIELSGEATGNIDNLERRSETYLATSSFGHGISVTPLQMVTAVGAIANSGKLMKPYIIDSIREDSKERKIVPQFVRQVISPSTAATLSAMMTSVLENGYGRRARVNGYFVAGKTGTAEVPKKGAGYTEDVIHSFVGFAPAHDPRFVTLVKLDNPKEGRFADSTAAPTFGKIADFILKYYNIAPDRDRLNN